MGDKTGKQRRLTFSLKNYKELFKDSRQGGDIMCVCV